MVPPSRDRDPVEEPAPEAEQESPAAQRAYAHIAADPDFDRLRHGFRRFVLSGTIVFMVWYVLYVACNNWARDFMNTPVIGNVNVALIFGLLQFVSTFAIAVVYARVAGRRFDPVADRLRAEFDTATGRTSDSEGLR